MARRDGESPPSEGSGARLVIDYDAIARTLRGMLDEIDAKGRATVAEEIASEDRFADVIDLASAQSNSAMAFRLRDREHKMMRKIHLALRRMEDGTYGICEDCGESIALARLQARPVTTLCAECKADREAEELLREE